MSTSSVALLVFLLQAVAGQNASIQGRVTAAEAPNGLARVTVELRRIGEADAPLISSTTEDGRFVFTNLPAGQYRMTARRNGLVPGEYGQRNPGSPGLPITLAAGQQLRDVPIVMTPSAAISGRILSRTGKPVVNAEVMAMKVSFQDGRRVLTLVQSARTNDLGEYRLYWLTPGKYYVSSIPWDERPIGGGVVLNASAPAAPVDIARMTVLAGDTARAPLGFQPTAPPSDLEAWVPIYFPGTANEDSASVIELEAGASVRGIDVNLAPVRPRRLRGTVVDAQGQPVSGAQIFRSRTASTSNTFTQEMVHPSDGTFEIRGVIPGSYTLLAISGDRAGKITLDVSETDVEGIRIPVAVGSAMSGRVSIEGQAIGNAVTGSLRVSLRPDPLLPGLPIPAGNVGADGAFMIGQVMPGNYLVTVQPFQLAPPVATAQRGNAMPPAPQRGGPALPPLPPALQNAYVKSVRLGAVDVLNNGLSVDAQSGAALEVVIASNPGRVDGDVGRLPNATVALVPAARMRRPDLYKSVLTDAEGRFEFQGVPPGEYLLLAWNNVEPGAWMNADFLKPYEDRGRLVRVGEGSRQTVTQLSVLD
ncbi:MAG TPA: carboxypeptidase-like regulatory domain-containing protein [Terriglobia bacterium]|nr:carboxypeptidase-like regulatory domain-containing protein [Terriglobia bacterium]